MTRTHIVVTGGCSYIHCLQNKEVLTPVFDGVFIAAAL